MAPDPHHHTRTAYANPDTHTHPSINMVFKHNNRWRGTLYQSHFFREVMWGRGACVGRVRVWYGLGMGCGCSGVWVWVWVVGVGMGVVWVVCSLGIGCGYGLGGCGYGGYGVGNGVVWV